MDLFPLNTFTLALSSVSEAGKTLVKHYTRRQKILSETCVPHSLWSTSPRWSRSLSTRFQDS